MSDQVTAIHLRFQCKVCVIYWILSDCTFLKPVPSVLCVPSVLWCCWSGGRKGSGVLGGIRRIPTSGFFWQRILTSAIINRQGTFRPFVTPRLHIPTSIFSNTPLRKGIRPVKKTERWGAGVVSVWSEVQTCVCPSWCHCHSLSLASVKSRLVLPFWYRLTWVVPEKGPLNGCMCVCVWLADIQFKSENVCSVLFTLHDINN